MHFQSSNLGNLECLLKQRSHVFKVRQQTFSVFVTFPAMSLVAVKAESIIKSLWLLARLHDELFTKFLERRQLASGNLEIGDNGAAFIFS